MNDLGFHRQESCDSHTFRLWIGGDYDTAVQACREFSMSGFCVAVQKCDYVFTMGMESGVCVTLINYPRLPAPPERLEERMIELGYFLAEKLFQGSFSVEGPDKTHWFSRRPGDQA